MAVTGSDTAVRNLFPLFHPKYADDHLEDLNLDGKNRV